MYTAKNYATRSGLTLANVWVALTSLTINKSDHTSLKLQNGDFTTTFNPNTHVTFKFGVFKDEASLLSGLEPIESFGVPNPNYNPDIPHDNPTQEVFSFNDNENETQEGIIAKAYQHLLDLNVLTIEGGE